MKKTKGKKEFYFKNFICLFLFTALHTIFFFLFTPCPIREVTRLVSLHPQILLLNGVIIFALAMFFYSLTGRVKIALCGNGLVIFCFAFLNRMQIQKLALPLYVDDLFDGLQKIQYLLRNGQYPDVWGSVFLVLFVAITLILLHPLHFKPISGKGCALTFCITLLSVSTVYLSVHRNVSLWEKLSPENQVLSAAEEYNFKGALYGFVYTLDKPLQRTDKKVEEQRQVDGEKTVTTNNGERKIDAEE